MRADVIDLHHFYSTRLGAMAHHWIDRHLTHIWRDTASLNVLGYGFATPYLERHRLKAARAIAVMPASQGVRAWPTHQRNLVVLCEDDILPVPDQSIDRLLIVHALESSENSRALLREAWRILSDSGRLMIIAPNRRGLWAQRPNTPFAVGQPFTGRQLCALVEDSLFIPTKPTYCLYAPPIDTALIRKFSQTFERLGSRWFKKFGGLVMIEAQKNLFSPALKQPARAQRRILFPAPARRASAQAPTIEKLDG